MLMWISRKLHIRSLRTFIVIVIVGIVVAALVFSGILFYARSAAILKNNYDQNIMRQFDQINNLIDDRVNQIDSIFPLLMSNMTIRENLEPTSDVYRSTSSLDRQLVIERQVTSLIISNYLWNQKFINGIYICGVDERPNKVSLKSQTNMSEYMEEVAQLMSADPSLQILAVSNRENSLYFARNIYSIYTGSKIACIIIEIDQNAWKKAYSESMDEHWLVYLFSTAGQLLNKPSDSAYEENIRQLLESNYFGLSPQVTNLRDTNYEVIATTLSASGITSVIAAPTEYLYQELHTTLKGFIWMFAVMILLALIATSVISGLITAPIKNMITQVQEISRGNRNCISYKSMYSEFNDFADAFNAMLDQLEINYSELYEKQVLLKNAEIKALQSQINPHFLFNVLDSIAWKAEISDNDEIYQMVISLAEMLRMNILSKETEFIPLEQELKYIRFYIHLQQMRFEGKFHVSIDVDESLLQVPIPCLCIQPLVENAIIHGLEPKKEPGTLRISIKRDRDNMTITVEDDGVGFREVPDIAAVPPSPAQRTHIGLKNLNRRLVLLYGDSRKLQISSVPNVSTVVSFSLPERRSEDDIPYINRG